MKRLFTLAIYLCLSLSTWAQKMDEIIWGVPATASITEAQALIHSKKGYTPNVASKEELHYQYKKIMGMVADNIVINYSNGAPSLCYVTYNAGNEKRAMSIIDSLYPVLVKEYGYPPMAEESNTTS